jgi:hypothetical protein
MSKREVRYLWVVEGCWDMTDPNDWVPFRMGAFSLEEARKNKKDLEGKGAAHRHGDRTFYRIRKYVPFIEK